MSGNRRENLSKHDQQSTTGRQFGFRRRWLVIVISLLLLWLLLPAGLTLIARCLIRQDKLQPADVAVALSGDARCWRERQAAALYQQGLARRIVVGGVPYAWGMHTGEAARRYLVAQQIPAADVLVLKDTWNTRVEADLLIALMRAQGWRSAIIVTDPFHSRRALLTIRRAASDLTFLSAPLPAEPGVWRPEKWWTRRNDAWLAVREIMSWGNTLAGGLR